MRTQAISLDAATGSDKALGVQDEKNSWIKPYHLTIIPTLQCIKQMVAVEQWTVIEQAVIEDDLQQLMSLLQKPDAKITRTSLILASALGHREIVKYLLGVMRFMINPPKYANNFVPEYTPLHAAAEFGHLRLVKYFVKKLNADINVQDKHGLTVLARAVIGMQPEVVEYLIENTPIDYDLTFSIDEFHTQKTLIDFAKKNLEKYSLNESQAFKAKKIFHLLRRKFDDIIERVAKSQDIVKFTRVAAKESLNFHEAIILGLFINKLNTNEVLRNFRIIFEMNNSPVAEAFIKCLHNFKNGEKNALLDYRAFIKKMKLDEAFINSLLSYVQSDGFRAREYEFHTKLSIVTYFGPDEPELDYASIYQNALAEIIKAPLDIIPYLLPNADAAVIKVNEEVRYSNLHLVLALIDEFAKVKLATTIDCTYEKPEQKESKQNNEKRDLNFVHRSNPVNLSSVRIIAEVHPTLSHVLNYSVDVRKAYQKPQMLLSPSLDESQQTLEQNNDLNLDLSYQLDLAEDEDTQYLDAVDNQDINNLKIYKPNTKKNKKDVRTEVITIENLDNESDLADNFQLTADNVAKNTPAFMLTTAQGNYAETVRLVKAFADEKDQKNEHQFLFYRNENNLNLFQVAVASGSKSLVEFWLNKYRTLRSSYDFAEEIWSFPQDEQRTKTISTMDIVRKQQKSLKSPVLKAAYNDIGTFLVEEKFYESFRGADFLGPDLQEIMRDYAQSVPNAVNKEELARTAYCYHLVNNFKAEYLETLTNTVSRDEVYSCIQNLLKDPLKRATANDYASKEAKLKLLALICALIEFTENIILYPNQIFSNLILIGDESRSMFADVKMNEGKSIMFAMLAAYFGLLGYEVYFTSNTHDLVQRDMQRINFLFEKLNISNKVIAGTPQEVQIAILSSEVYGIRINGCKPRHDAKKIYLGDEIDVPAWITYLHGARFTLYAYNQEIEHIAELTANAMTSEGGINVGSLEANLKKSTDSITTLDAARWFKAAQTVQKKYANYPVKELAIEYMSLVNAEICHLVLSFIEQSSVEESAANLNTYLIKNLGKRAPQAQDVDCWFIAATQLKKMINGHNYKVKTYIDKAGVERREIVIVDYKYTGNPKPGQRWPFYLHSLIEAKEGCLIQGKSLPLATESNADFIKRFNLKIGMTGTLGSKDKLDQLEQFYQVKCVNFPRRRNNPVEIKIQEIIAANNAAGQRRVIRNVLDREINSGHSAIIFCETINDSIETHEFVKTLHKDPQLVGLYNDDQKTAVSEHTLKDAGKDRFVLTATSIASRGVDIKKIEGPIYVPNAPIESKQTEKTHFILIIKYLPISLEAALQLHYRIRGKKGKIYYCLNLEEIQDKRIKALLKNNTQLNQDKLLEEILALCSEASNKNLNNNQYQIRLIKNNFQNLYLSLPKRVRLQFDRNWSQAYAAFEEYINRINGQDYDLQAIENHSCKLLAAFWSENNVAKYLPQHESSPLEYAKTTINKRRIKNKEQYQSFITAMGRNIGAIGANHCAPAEIKSVEKTVATIATDYSLKETNLHLAVKRGNYQDVVKALNGEKPDILYHLTLNLCTALHYAVEKDNIEMTNVLLARDNEILEKKLMPELPAAVEDDNKKICKLHHYVNQMTKEGKTALHIAVIKGSEQLVDILSSHSEVKLHMKDHAGRAPLYYAVKANNLNIIKLLLKKANLSWVFTIQTNVISLDDLLKVLHAFVNSQVLSISNDLGSVLALAVHLLSTPIHRPIFLRLVDELQNDKNSLDNIYQNLNSTPKSAVIKTITEEKIHAVTTEKYSIYQEELLKTLKNVQAYIDKLPKIVNLTPQPIAYDDMVKMITCSDLSAENISLFTQIKIKIRDNLQVYWDSNHGPVLATTLQDYLKNARQDYLINFNTECSALEYLNVIRESFKLLSPSIYTNAFQKEFMDRAQELECFIHGCHFSSDDGLLRCKIAVCQIIFEFWHKYQIGEGLPIKKTSPLHWAVENGLLSIVRLLAEMRPSLLTEQNSLKLLPIDHAESRVNMGTIPSELVALTGEKDQSHVYHEIVQVLKNSDGTLKDTVEMDYLLENKHPLPILPKFVPQDALLPQIEAVSEEEAELKGNVRKTDNIMSVNSDISIIEAVKAFREHNQEIMTLIFQTKSPEFIQQLMIAQSQNLDLVEEVEEKYIIDENITEEKRPANKKVEIDFNAIFTAIQSNKISGLKNIFEHKLPYFIPAVFTALDADNNNILMWSIRHNHTEAITYFIKLLSKTPDLLLTVLLQQNSQLDNCLTLAIRNLNIDLVMCLLNIQEYGEKVSTQAQDKKTSWVHLAKLETYAKERLDHEFEEKNGIATLRNDFTAKYKNQFKEYTAKLKSLHQGKLSALQARPEFLKTFLEEHFTLQELKSRLPNQTNLDNNELSIVKIWQELPAHTQSTLIGEKGITYFKVIQSSHAEPQHKQVIAETKQDYLQNVERLKNDQLKLIEYLDHQERYFSQGKIEAVLTKFLTKSADVEFPLTREELQILIKRCQSVFEYKDDLQRCTANDLQKQRVECIEALNLNSNNELDKCRLIAIICEQVRRSFKLYPYNIQIINILAFLNAPNQKRIAQIKTGEGKSLTIAVLAAYLACFEPVDIVTSNETLANRDAAKFADFYNALTLSVNTVALPERSQDPKTYRANILYGTNFNYEHCYLHDCIHEVSVRGDRAFSAVIVDEVDNMFLDGHANSAIISDIKMAFESKIFSAVWAYVNSDAPNKNAQELKNYLITVIPGISSNLDFDEIGDFDFFARTWFLSGLKAIIKKENIDYIIKDGKVLIVDYYNTGAIHKNQRWNSGLHSILEAKHGLKIQDDRWTPCAINNVEFFKMYLKVYGLSGTLGAIEDRQDLYDLYGTSCYDAPTYRPSIKNGLPPIVCLNNKAHFSEISNVVHAMVSGQRPTLILCESINDSNQLFDFLYAQFGSLVHLYNELQKESADTIIHIAAQPSQITVATNNAGRGTDIDIPDEVAKKGGLHVIMTFPAPNRRIEAQGFGRSGRQGNPGTYQYILKLKDIYNEDPLEQHMSSQQLVKDWQSSRDQKNRQTSIQRKMEFNFSHLNMMVQKLLLALSKSYAFPINEKYHFNIIINAGNNLASEKQGSFKYEQQKLYSKLELHLSNYRSDFKNFPIAEKLVFNSLLKFMHTFIPDLNKHYYNILHIAIFYKNLELLQFFIKMLGSDAEILLNAKNQFKQTPYQLANELYVAELRQLEDLDLEEKTNTSRANLDNCKAMLAYLRPLHPAHYNVPVEDEKFASSHSKTVKVADLKKEINENETRIIAKFLPSGASQEEIDLNRQDKNGLTLFMFALKMGHISFKTLNALITNSNYYLPDIYGNSPMMMACALRRVDIIKLLLQFESNRLGLGKIEFDNLKEAQKSGLYPFLHQLHPKTGKSLGHFAVLRCGTHTSLQQNPDYQLTIANILQSVDVDYQQITPETNIPLIEKIVQGNKIVLDLLAVMGFDFSVEQANAKTPENYVNFLLKHSRDLSVNTHDKQYLAQLVQPLTQYTEQANSKKSAYLFSFFKPSEYRDAPHIILEYNKASSRVGQGKNE